MPRGVKIERLPECLDRPHLWPDRQEAAVLRAGEGGLDRERLGDRCRVPLVLECDAGLIAFHKYLEQRHRADRAEFGLEGATPRPAPECNGQDACRPPGARAPRLGDVTPVRAEQVAIRVQVVYQVKVPIPVGLTADVYA